MKRLLLALLFLPTFAMANDIYISQVGDSLDLDIVQDGTDNVIGTSAQNAVFGATGNSSANMTFSITQTGNQNTIAAQIYGSTYTGTWTFTGNSNTVDLLCDSGLAGNCATVTLDIATTGSSNDYKIYIGETADAGSAIIDFTVTGDNNVTDMDIDGTSADVTVVMNNSASLASQTTTSLNDANLSTTNAGNILDFDIDGNGDVSGHTIDLTITGGASVYTITQSGVNDNMVTASFDGDYQEVDITQSD